MPLVFPATRGDGKPQPKTRLAQTPLNNRCVGAWLLGEGSNHWFDSSPQGRTMSQYIDSAGTYNEPAPFNKGRLGGTSFRNTGTSKNFTRTDRNYTPPTSNFSANLWVFPYSFADYYVYFDQWDETPNKRCWEIWAFGDGTIHASSSSNGSAFHREDGPAISTFRWSMITATFPASGGTLKLYINGAQVSTSSAGSEGYSGLFNTAQPVYLGYSPGTAGTGAKFSNVRIEAASIWERVLSDDEIAGLYRDQFRQWERPRLRKTVGGVIVPPSYQYSLSPRAQRAVYLRQ